MTYDWNSWPEVRMLDSKVNLWDTQYSKLLGCCHVCFLIGSLWISIPVLGHIHLHPESSIPKLHWKVQKSVLKEMCIVHSTSSGVLGLIDELSIPPTEKLVSTETLKFPKQIRNEKRKFQNLETGKRLTILQDFKFSCFLPFFLYLFLPVFIFSLYSSSLVC